MVVYCWSWYRRRERNKELTEAPPLCVSLSFSSFLEFGLKENERSLENVEFPVARMNSSLDILVFFWSEENFTRSFVKSLISYL